MQPSEAKTGSCSRMASECQKCPDKDKCQNKRMEMLAYTIQRNIAENVHICQLGEIRRK